jgi:2-oxo-4-hydroxy-4-carboxy--5-ureidoimidazoline (OHCU) decarboxylase
LRVRFIGVLRRYRSRGTSPFHTSFETTKINKMIISNIHDPLKRYVNDKARELETAALEINPEALDAARVAIAEGCHECLRWTRIFRDRLDSVNDEEVHRFARAFSLIMLGVLPTKPSTCPFCSQYGQDRGCLGCGYARTHGPCNFEDSSFSLFIEAFHELGRAIYQDMSFGRSDPSAAGRILLKSIDSSEHAAQGLLSELQEASTFRLMELKASYMDRMIGCLPLALLSEDIGEMCAGVRECLKNYW